MALTGWVTWPSYHFLNPQLFSDHIHIKMLNGTEEHLISQYERFKKEEKGMDGMIKRYLFCYIFRISIFLLLKWSLRLRYILQPCRGKRAHIHTSRLSFPSARSFWGMLMMVPWVTQFSYFIKGHRHICKFVSLRTHTGSRRVSLIDASAYLKRPSLTLHFPLDFT